MRDVASRERPGKASREPRLRVPAWLDHLVRTNRPAMPWRDVARFAVTIPAPLAVALLVGGPSALGAGVFATTGALAATLAPQPGPLRDKLRRIAAAISFGALGLAIGQYASGEGFLPVVLVALTAAVAGLLSSISATLSLGSLQLLIYTALASGLVSPLPFAAELAFFFAGAAWATLTTLIQAAVLPVDPDRHAVAAVFRRTAELLAASGTEHAEEARRALTAALNTGYDRVIRSRAHSSGRIQELAELAGVLNSAAPLIEGAVVTARSGEPADRDDVAAVRDLAETIAGHRQLPARRPPALEDAPPARKTTRHGIRLVWNVVGDPEERAGAAMPRPRVGWRGRVREAVDRAISAPESREFALRLALCMSVAEIARQLLPLPRPYWVLLTVAIVLKPDFGSVFARAVQRGAGTALGVLLGSLLLTVLPTNGWVLVPMALSAAALPWARGANFGLLAVFLTPLVILLLDLAVPDGSGLVGARLIDTLLGSAIVLVFGYLLWPQTWRAPLDDALHAALSALDAFIHAAFTGSPVDRRRARRRSYRALTEVQTQLQRRLAEPPPISTRASAWWPVIVQLERASDAVTEGALAVEGGEPAPAPAQVTALRRAVRQLDGELRLRTPTDDDAEVLAEGVLGPVAREIDAARRLVREAAPDRRPDPASRD